MKSSSKTQLPPCGEAQGISVEQWFYCFANRSKMPIATMNHHPLFKPNHSFFDRWEIYLLGRTLCCYVVVVLALTTASAQVIDLSGQTIEPLKIQGHKAVVLIFVDTDCPISNRYAPEIKRITEKFAPDNMKFYLIYPGTNETAEAIKNHAQMYEYEMNILRDPQHQLVKMTGVKVTPEAAVFVAGKLVYRGRIDNRFVAFGKLRPAPTTRDLEQVLEALRKGKRRVRKTTTALGCFIS